MLRRWLLVLVAAGLLGAAGPEADRFDTVVVDAGHGGEDHGARGARGLQEKDLVLDVARLLAKELRERELQVVMTRDEDRFVSLEERTALANDARGDLFLSIHANAARTRAPRGSETFFASLEATDEAAGEVAARENRAFASPAGGGSALADPLLAILEDLIATEHLSDSSELARLVQARLARANGLPSRGVKQAPFVVLLGVRMPAALVELGFVTNAKDEGELGSRAGRQKLASALAEAILEFGRRYDARRGVEASQSLVWEGP